MPSTTITALEEKLHDLCAAIAADEEVAAAREAAEAFLADESAVSLYRQMAQAQHQFEHRHQSGEKISDAERTAYAGLRDRAEASDLVRSFTEAQETLQGVANLVNGFVTKTLEKGRVPTSDEVFGQGGGCGTGCGCH